MWRSWDSFDFISFRGDIVAGWNKGDRSGGELSSFYPSGAQKM